jgi:hypothetical protein
MHVRDLVELAAVVAVHAPIFARRGNHVPQTAVEQYWVASKCRIDRWLRLLRRLNDAAGQLPLPAPLAWPRVQPVLEEILASELLTRIWTAAAVAHDENRSDENLAPIARNIWLSHLDVRRRLLALIAQGQALNAGQSEWLDKLRRRMERWSDMLLAHLNPLIDTAEFAVDAGRARDFADDLSPQATAAERTLTCQIVQASLTASLAQTLAEGSPNADLNRRIASAILACLPESLLACGEVASSLWLERLARTAAGAEQMIDDLVRLESTLAAASPERL